MSHMNYFEPYQSIATWHEDQLTRAYLVVLRYSPAALLSFYDRVRTACLEMAEKKSEEVTLPSTSELPLAGVEFSTQITTISREPVSSVLSVLLTDSTFEPNDSVSPSDRAARYDGIVTFGDEIALVIENKPLQANVWEGQLSPSKKDLSEDAILVSVPAIVEWRSIVSSLNELMKMDSMGGAEKLMIDDFLSYVNVHYPYLNPFDHLSHCGNDNRLIRRRIENLLIPLAGPKSSVRDHRGWGMCMNFELPEIRSVGVIAYNISKNSGHLTVSLYFGDTQSQSQAFYRRNLEYDHIKKNLGNDWEIKPNFHVGSINKVLLRLECPPGRANDYYEFWRTHPKLIKQHNLDGLLRLIKELETKGLISITEDNNSKIEYIKTTNYEKFNICPSMGIHYRIPIERARELDNDRNELAGELYKRMNEGLNLVLSDTSRILKDPRK